MYKKFNAGFILSLQEIFRNKPNAYKIVKLDKLEKLTKSEKLKKIGQN